MKKAVIAVLLGLVMSTLVHAQDGLTVGKSNATQWSERSSGKGRNAWRQLAITSTDGKSELIVEFYPEMGGLGMTISFFDRPARTCHTATLEAIQNTSLLLDGKSLPGEHADSFGAGCADEQWIERGVFGSEDADIAIVQALLDANDNGVVHLSSTDGSFDHSFSANGFRALEHGDMDVYRHSKGYKLVKSMEH
jgi:hypothetical protein